jgi:class 3 adenylate cyclase/DNA-binding transcriptional MerR regulator
LLTSKEIIERTGISRATLNNYIASGLVPRPQVLPPGPEHGDAPRIGYFPDDTIERVETIQRLKREGWSITRISEHFARGGVAPVPAAPAPAARTAVPTPSVPDRPAVFDGNPALTMFVGEVRYPAYLVDDRFHVMWMNDPARESALSPLAGRPGGETDNVFRHLLELEEADGREALLRFHLEAAKDRAHRPEDLFRDITSAQANRLQEIYAAVQRPDAGMVTQARLPATARQPARAVYAVHFREAVLFAFGPATAGSEQPQQRAGLASRNLPAPVNAPVAVLVATLQDASVLWVKLTAQEYFELLNEVWTELEQIFRSHAGRPGRQPGEVLVWYFASQGDAGYLWNALAAAQQAREAMRRVSRRWQVRKGWDVELAMNMGVDEGREWLGAVGAQADVRVLGEAADRAEQLSRCGRAGAVLSTRSLLGKLPPPERQRITYGVPRRDGSGARVLFTFDRLQDLAGGAPVPPRLADVAVAEVLDLNIPPASAPGAAR